jgi:hypothetical protein
VQLSNRATDFDLLQSTPPGRPQRAVSGGIFRNFFDRVTLRRLTTLADNVRSSGTPFSSRRHWPVINHFSRDRSMAYFVACVKSRNLLNRLVPPPLQLIDLFVLRLERVLGHPINVASCPTFGPLFPFSAATILENASEIRQARLDDIRPWVMQSCVRIWKVIVPIFCEEDSGYFATYRHRRPLLSVDDLVGSDVQHFFPGLGDALIFDATLPHEQIAAQGNQVFLECYLGQLQGHGRLVIWS